MINVLNVKQIHKSLEIDGPQCAFRVLDMGIVIGSSAKCQEYLVSIIVLCAE